MNIVYFDLETGGVEDHNPRTPWRRSPGTNIARFDIPRLERMIERNGKPFFPGMLYWPRDTYMRAIWYFDEHPEMELPANYRLSTLAEYFGMPSEGAHDALADVRMCAALARRMSVHRVPSA